MIEAYLYLILSGLSLIISIFEIIEALKTKKEQKHDWIPMFVLGLICVFMFILFLVLGILEVVV